MQLTAFSPKQLRVLCWWAAGSPDRHRAALICDGAVRSGKSYAVTISFCSRDWPPWASG